MNDEIHEIQEHPAASRDALDVVRRLPGVAQCLDDAIGETPHVRIRRAGRDYEEIGGVTETAKIENLHADSLAIFDGANGGTDGSRHAWPAAVSQGGQPRPVTRGARSCLSLEDTGCSSANR
jgi:hypothetical protein